MKRYMVKEIFYSLQGEGVRAGTANVFVRFAGCNLACSLAKEGFDCDTDFAGGTAMTAREILNEMHRAARLVECDWCILTGGEPALQVDDHLISQLKDEDWKIAIETNGTRCLPDGIDWVCVSPKPHTIIEQRSADEVKFVLDAGMTPPETSFSADHILVSPAHDGDKPRPGALDWCIQLVKDNPDWRLSVQQHKQWGVR